MTDLTHYGETQVLDWFSQGVDLVAPTNLHVALHTADPGDNPDGTTEVTATDYARYQTATGTDWNVTGNAPRTTDNATEITFGTATNSWGTISHVSLWDAATGGNCLAAYALSTSKAIDVDDEAQFAAGDLSFQVD